MKENIIRIMRLPVAAALVTVAVSCVGLFDEFNRNPNETTDMELQRDNYNVGGKLLQLQNCVIPTEEHLYQFTEILAGMSYGGYAEGTVPDWSTRFSTFNPSSDWLKAPFVDVMTDTYAPYRGIYAATEDPVPLALADILRVATMHRLTDQYGPIPYSKVMENKENSLTVAYDTQEEVYLKMFEELDDAIVVLKNNWDLPAEALMEYDKVYNGNIAQWVKYANSLKLRMAMRLSYVNPELSKQKASEAIAGGIMATNADNAAFKPDINRTAMIWNDWMDHIISADLVSYMGGYNDPRRYKMFIKKSAGILNYDTFQYDTKIDTLGAIRIGTRVLLKDDAIKYGSRPIIAETDPILWMNAAEVAFLQAEYHLRWGTMTDAGAWYRKGVELSSRKGSW